MADDTNTEATEQGAPEPTGYSFSMANETPEEAVEPQTPSFTLEVPNTEVAEVKLEEAPEPKPELESEIEEEFEYVDADAYDELTPEMAKEFLKENEGIDIDALMTPKEQKKFAPLAEKWNEFIENTGNENIEDFLATQKDWDAESPENTLKEYIKIKNPDLTKKELDFLYEDKYSTEGLDEEDDESLIIKKGISAKTDLREAKELLEARKAEYMVHKGLEDSIPEEYKQAKAQYDSLLKQEEEKVAKYEEGRSEYLSNVEAIYSDDFKGFEIEVGNDEIGFEKIHIKPDNMKETRDFVSDISNFSKKFYDADGNITDQKGLNDSLLKARNYERDMKIAYNLGMAKKAELDDRKSKNIQADNAPSNTNPNTGGWVFHAEEPK